MIELIIPAIWILVLISGLPLLSETVYSPSLPDIAHALYTSESMAEYTLTIYLFGFALGTLFWGKLSDHIGRKPGVILGFFIFILGCAGCYASPTIFWLMASRFLQAFGGSVGSVLGQAICRDAFHGPMLGKMYSLIGASIAVFPAFGPVIGGFIAQHYGWRNIFIFLGVFTFLLIMFLIKKLPETHRRQDKNVPKLKDVLRQLCNDRRVIGCGVLVGLSNGIGFSYFSEGSFYLISLLGLSPQKYGMSFLPMACCAVVGGLYSKYLHNFYGYENIIKFGIRVSVVCTALFTTFILVHTYIYTFPTTAIIALTLILQSGTRFGISLVTGNTLALALLDYKWCIGTASSLFGFFYYCLISLCTLGMGWLHNGTLLPMPLYFFTLTFSMFFIHIKMIAKISKA
jgi:Bcr/CflA subfamily drug resistance transporter